MLYTVFKRKKIIISFCKIDIWHFRVCTYTFFWPEDMKKNKTKNDRYLSETHTYCLDQEASQI